MGAKHLYVLTKYNIYVIFIGIPICMDRSSRFCGIRVNVCTVPGMYFFRRSRMSSNHIFQIIGGPGKFDLMQALFASTGARMIPIKIHVEGAIRRDGDLGSEISIIVNQVGWKLGSKRGTVWTISGTSNTIYKDGEELGSVVLTYDTTNRKGEVWIDRLIGA